MPNWIPPQHTMLGRWAMELSARLNVQDVRILTVEIWTCSLKVVVTQEGSTPPVLCWLRPWSRWPRESANWSAQCRWDLRSDVTSLQTGSFKLKTAFKSGHEGGLFKIIKYLTGIFFYFTEPATALKSGLDNCDCVGLACQPMREKFAKDWMKAFFHHELSFWFRMISRARTFVNHRRTPNFVELNPSSELSASMANWPSEIVLLRFSMKGDDESQGSKSSDLNGERSRRFRPLVEEGTIKYSTNRCMAIVLSPTPRDTCA